MYFSFICLFFFVAGGSAGAEGMLSSKRCLSCHADYGKDPNIIAGEFDSLSLKAKTFQVAVDDSKQLLKFKDDTQVINAEGMKGLKAPVPVMVRFSKVGPDMVAEKVVAKPPIKVPEEQIISTKELERLVALGPEKGNFTLVDSRPEVKFNEGHIPGAISIPFPKMAQMADRLPKDKGKLLIFYCEGVRCVLSPMASKMAAKAGYTNVKVYHPGAPDWVKNGNPLLSTYEFLSKRLAFVITIDTRGPKAAEKGHIQGAVAMPLEDVAKQRNQFPLDKKAYIVLYSEDTNLAGLSPLVKEIIGWGYERVYVLDGGYNGWIKNKGLIQSGMVRTEIFYMPRPHPGEITGDEFVNIMKNLPQDKMILDVRTQAETAMGMIKGAKNIPVDDLQARLAELPKDKEIIVHCRTGLRAEMGYTILRNAGFKTRFLNDKVAILEDQVFCCYKE